jgi:hypothetical protein
LFTKSGNRFEDLVGGFGPDEWFRIPIVMVEESSNCILEFASAAVQLLFSKEGEPAFDQVKPGITGRGEVQVEARVAQQPTFDGQGLVRSVITKNQVRV